MSPPEDRGTERSTGEAEEVQLIVFVPPSLVPERWRSRAVNMAMVPLLPREAGEILRGEPARPEIGPEDERLLELVVRRLPVKAIAQETNVSVRGVQHRLGRLRRRFGVASTADLAILAARRGFGGVAKVKRNAKGGHGEDAES